MVERAPPERRLTLADINRALDRLGPHAFIPRTRMPRRSFRSRLAAFCETLVSAHDSLWVEWWSTAAEVVVESAAVPSRLVIPTDRRE